MTNGTLTIPGAATTTIQSAFDPGPGTITGGGTLNTSGTTTVNSGNPTLNGGTTWNNSGTINISGSSEIFVTNVGPPSVLNNLLGGTINDTTSSIRPIFGNTNPGAFSNSGTFNKNVGSAATQSFSGLTYTNNAGATVNVNDGTLDWGSATSNEGAINVAATATLSRSGNLTNSSTGIIAGSGTVNLGANTLSNSGTIRPGGQTTRGTLAVTGNVNFTGGTLDIDVAGTTTPGTDYDTISITGAATLGGTVNVAERAGFTTTFTDAITAVQYGSRTGSTTFGTINTTLTSGTAAFGQTNNATNTVFSLTSGVTNYTALGLTNWSLSSNWDRGTPTATTDAFVTLGGANSVTVNTNESAKSLTVSANNTLNVTNASTLNVANVLNNSGTVNVLAQSSGFTTLTVGTGIANTGLLNLVNEPGNFRPAVLDVTTGTLTNAVGATLRSSGPVGTANVVNAPVTNLGTMDMQRAMTITNTGRTFLSDAGTLNFAAGAVLTANGGTTTLGSGTVFTGTGGTLSLINTPTLNLSGNLTLPAGPVTLNLNGASAATVSATVPGKTLTVGAGASLTLEGDTIASSVNLVNSGTVNVVGTSTSTINGALTNNAGATLSLQANSGFAGTTLTVADGSTFTQGGLLNLVNEPGNFRPAVLDVTTGTLTNAVGATLRSSGPVGTANVVNATVANLGLVDLQRPMTIANLPTNDGTISFTANNPALVLSNATLTNNAAGVIEGTGTLNVGTLANAGSIRPGGLVARGTLAFVGNVDFTGGTLQLDVAGVTTPGTDFDKVTVTGAATLAGTVNVIEQAGFKTAFTDVITPVVYGSRTGTFGAINTTTSSGVASYGASYNPTSAVFLLATGQSTYTGTGATNWGLGPNWDRGTPTASVDAIINTAGVNTITLNTTEAVKSLVLTGTNTLAITGGVLDIGAASSVAAGSTLSLSGGTLQGVGAVAINGAFNWSGGTLAGAGTTIVAAGGTLSISGAGAKFLDTRTLVNNSAAGSTWSGAGNITRVGGADGIFNNAGLLDIQGDASFTHGAFNNSGTLVKSAGAGLTQFNAATGSFTNTGTVNANTGTLRLFNAPTNAGLLNIAAGATISTGSLASAGIIGGFGTLDLNGGTLINAGIVAPGTSPGTLTIVGNYTQAASGTLAVELGGTTAGTGFDVLAVTGNAALDGTLAVTNFGGFLPAAADVFRFLTVGGTRTGTFASTTLPVGYTGGATYGATFAELAPSAAVVVVPPPPPALPGPLIVTVAQDPVGIPTASENNIRTVVASLDRMIDVIVGAPAKKAADDESGDGSVLMCK